MPCTQRVGILLYSACARLSFGLTLLRCFSAASNFSRAPTRSPPLRSATASFISDSASLHDATTSAQMTYVCAAYVCGGGEWSAYLPVEGWSACSASRYPVVLTQVRNKDALSLESVLLKLTSVGPATGSPDTSQVEVNGMLAPS